MTIGDFVTLEMRVCTLLQHVHTIPRVHPKKVMDHAALRSDLRSQKS